MWAIKREGGTTNICDQQVANPFNGIAAFGSNRSVACGHLPSTTKRYSAFEETLATGPSGIIISPGRPAELKSLIRKAAQQNILVIVGSDWFATFPFVFRAVMGARFLIADVQARLPWESRRDK